LRAALRAAANPVRHPPPPPNPVGAPQVRSHLRAGVSARPAVVRPIVLIDAGGDVYPPAVAALGISPDRLLVVRPRWASDALWAAEQALRCPAVGAVVATSLAPDGAQSRRLQLAAESGGTLGLILGPARRRETTFAAVRLLLEAVPLTGGWPSAPPGGRWCRVSLLKVREGMPVEPFIAELEDETFDVPVFPACADRAERRQRCIA